MSIVVLDAMEGRNSISNKLREAIISRGEELSYIELRDMNILPCRSCDACGYRSPGKCVFDDDMHDIHRAMARSSAIILLTPVRFGGYPSTLKKAVDKFMHMCLPSYGVKDGHLIHPTRYGSKMLMGIGVQQGCSKGREASFSRLVENNAWNLQFEYKAVVLDSTGDMESIGQNIENLLKEVC